MIQVTSLHIYPIKGCGGISLQEMEFGPSGPRYDRQWMLVDSQGKFVTQRELPRLALIRPYILNQKMSLTTTTGQSTFFQMDEVEGADLDVVVWKSRCQAQEVSPRVSAWLSDFLKTPVRLVKKAPHDTRRLSPELGDEPLSFVDSCPLLILSEESLAFLNRKLKEALPMNRFRPNIVVKGLSQAHGEDSWKRFQVGAQQLRNLKPCSRCQVTMTDQNTGVVGKEPLATLATYRMSPRGIVFGMNAAHENEASIQVGDEVRLK